MLANDCIALIIFLWTTLYIRVVILMPGGTEAPKEYRPKPMECIFCDFTVPSTSKFPSSTTRLYTTSTVPTVPTVLKFNSSNQFNSSPWPLLPCLRLGKEDLQVPSISCGDHPPMHYRTASLFTIFLHNRAFLIILYISEKGARFCKCKNATNLVAQLSKELFELNVPTWHIHECVMIDM